MTMAQPVTKAGRAHHPFFNAGSCVSGSATALLNDSLCTGFYQREIGVEAVKGRHYGGGLIGQKKMGKRWAGAPIWSSCLYAIFQSLPSLERT